MAIHRCDRCSHTIPAGTVYRVSGPRCSATCPACSEAVFGPSWALGKYSDICRDGIQVEWRDRSHWVLGGELVTAAWHRVFTEADPATWEHLPVGYVWRTFNAEVGEQHLHAPDGRDVTAAYLATRVVVTI